MNEDETTPRSIIDKAGGRRFFLALGAGVVVTFLVWVDKIPPEIYRDIVIATVAAYIVGNTWQKVRGPHDSDHSYGGDGEEDHSMPVPGFGTDDEPPRSRRSRRR